MKWLAGGACAVALAGATDALVAPTTPGFTDATILILIGGILSIIAAIGKVWLDVIAGNRETAKVHGLVDGQHLETLNEIAALKRLVAELSGRKDDQVRAVASQAAADDHRAQVIASEAKE